MQSSIHYLFMPLTAAASTERPAKLLRMFGTFFVFDMVTAFFAWQAIIKVVEHAITGNPAIRPEFAPFIALFAVALTSFSRVVLVAGVALLFHLAVFVQGSAPRFQQIFFSTAVAAFPMVLGRLVRAVLYKFGAIHDLNDRAISLLVLVKNFLPNAPHWLGEFTPFDLWIVGVALMVIPPQLPLPRRTAVATTAAILALIILMMLRVRGLSGA